MGAWAKRNPPDEGAVVAGVLPVLVDGAVFGNWKAGAADEAGWLDAALFPSPKRLVVPVLAPKVDELGGGPAGVVD